MKSFYFIENEITHREKCPLQAKRYNSLHCIEAAVDKNEARTKHEVSSSAAWAVATSSFELGSHKSVRARIEELSVLDASIDEYSSTGFHSKKICST